MRYYSWFTGLILFWCVLELILNYSHSVLQASLVAHHQYTNSTIYGAFSIFSLLHILTGFSTFNFLAVSVLNPALIGNNFFDPFGIFIVFFLSTTVLLLLIRGSTGTTWFVLKKHLPSDLLLYPGLFVGLLGVLFIAYYGPFLYLSSFSNYYSRLILSICLCFLLLLLLLEYTRYTHVLDVCKFKTFNVNGHCVKNPVRFQIFFIRVFSVIAIFTVYVAKEWIPALINSCWEAIQFCFILN